MQLAADSRQLADDRRQMTEVRDLSSEVGSQTTEDGGQKTELRISNCGFRIANLQISKFKILKCSYAPCFLLGALPTTWCLLSSTSFEEPFM
jgi:hypothetical protein